MRTLLVLFPFALQAQVTALRFGTVIDGKGQSLRDAVIIVDGDKVARVAKASDPLPANATVIDLRKYTAIPGLIDLHTHMTYYWDRNSGTRPFGQPARPRDSTILLARENLRKTLETGVTTVRDLGASSYTDIALRDSVN